MVKCVFPFRGTTPGATPNEAYAEMLRKMELLRGINLGRPFCVACSLHLSKQQKPTSKLGAAAAAEAAAAHRDMYVVDFVDEAPQKSYLLLKNQVLESDREMLTLLDRNRAAIRQVVEIKGQQFAVGDFIVRFGTVMQAKPPNAGVIVEVDYRPCTAVDGCTGLLVEFISSYLGVLDLSQHCARPDFSGLNLPSSYGLRHAASQYVAVLRQMEIFKLNLV
eukprot:gnl/Hemi2/4857_TR1681_c0_g1_i1.p2 gnl/Hemi2/4857_TR1681_c0_g1~~gnl/Hemi2/4857_TR1681_c0_g1_i1.p2  ORF type:complete len:220 (+),score=55.70 gnl/Hemi2/4857_TR1681_c0_g1_i1:94-753(+)